MMRARRDLEPLRQRLIECGRSLCEKLLPGGTMRGNDYVDRRLRAGGTFGDSCQVCLAGPKAGYWAHFAAAAGGRDLIGFVAYAQGLKYGEAIAWCERWLGEPDIAVEARRRPRVEIDRRRADGEEDSIRRARAIWAQGRRIEGTLAETYLNARGLFAELWPSTLRFVPKLHHFSSGFDFPALIAAVQEPAAADDEICGVWRIFLARDGKCKAPIHPARLGKGRKRGCAVRLSPATDRLAIGEGLETTLALGDVQKGWPLWAALDAGNLALLVEALPSSVKELVIGADHDPPRQRPNGTIFRPGQEAAAKAARIARMRGIACAILMPAIEGTDFDDLMMRERV